MECPLPIPNTSPSFPLTSAFSYWSDTFPAREHPRTPHPRPSRSASSSLCSLAPALPSSYTAASISGIIRKNRSLSALHWAWDLRLRGLYSPSVCALSAYLIRCLTVSLRDLRECEIWWLPRTLLRLDGSDGVRIGKGPDERKMSMVMVGRTYSSILWFTQLNLTHLRLLTIDATWQSFFYSRSTNCPSHLIDVQQYVRTIKSDRWWFTPKDPYACRIPAYWYMSHDEYIQRAVWSKQNYAPCSCTVWYIPCNPFHACATEASTGGAALMYSTYCIACSV